MTLATLYPKISRALRRANSVDSLIPDWVEDAALWLEQNYNFGYMKRTVTVDLDPDATTPNLIEFDERIKTFKFIRYPSDTAESYTYLRKVDPMEVTSIDSGRPGYYWRDGPNQIWLDAKVQEPLTLEIRASFYTDWPSTDTASPTLEKFYPNLLKYSALRLAATDLKDPDMVDRYTTLFQEALTAVLVAEEEDQREDTEAWMQP